MIGYNRYILGVYMGSIEAKAAIPGLTAEPVEAEEAQTVDAEAEVQVGETEVVGEVAVPLVQAEDPGVDQGWSTMFAGVPESAWYPADQERMARGELPEGSPEHPNI